MGALEGLLKLYREKSKAIMTEWFERVCKCNERTKIILICLLVIYFLEDDAY